MIDQQIREHVVRQVDAVAGSQGSITEVMRRGRRRRRAQKGTLVAVVALSVVGVVAVATQVPTAPIADVDPDPSADRVTIVNPGGGPGDLAEAMAKRMPYDVVERSTSHVGSVETPEGRFDVATFSAVVEYVGQPDEPAACVGVTRDATTSGESRSFVSSCQPTAEVRPLSRFWGDGDFYWVLDRVPEDTTLVVVTTSRGNTIAIRSTDFVFATWPTNWGPPETLTAYNSGWAETGFIDYTQ